MTAATPPRTPVTPPSNRASRGRVLDALRRGGPMTRADLATNAGLSRATVSAVLRDLLATGHVCEERPTGPRERGRPSSLVRLNPTRVDCVGIEVGRAHVAVALADAGDRLVAQEHRAVEPLTDATARARIAVDLVRSLVEQRGLDMSVVRAAAVGTPGPDFAPGAAVGTDLAVTRAVRTRTTVADLIAHELGCAVDAGNNTRFTARGVAAAAETRSPDLVYLRLDQGVGGGVVLDGVLVEGRWGAAGEFGHVSVDPDGARCACGGRGCLELVASMPALLAATRTPTPAALQRAVVAGRHARVLTRAARATAQVLATAVVALDCPAVVCGGAVAELPGFLERVRTALIDLAPTWAVAELSLRSAVDDSGAGARGALIQARARADANHDRATARG